MPRNWRGATARPMQVDDKVIVTHYCRPTHEEASRNRPVVALRDEVNEIERARRAEVVPE